MRQNIVITLGRCKRAIQSLLRFGALLIDELPTDLMLSGKSLMGDKLAAMERA